MAVDKRTTLEKLGAGDVGSFDGGDVANVASNALQFAGPVGVLLSAPVDGLGAGEHAWKDQKDFNEQLGLSMQDAAIYSDAVKRAFDRMNNAAVMTTGSAATASGGAFAGAAAATAIGTAILPGAGTAVGWVIGMAGSLAGAGVAGAAYNAAFGSTEEAAITMTANLRRKQFSSQAVSAQEVFAVLVANLDSKAQERVNKRIEKIMASANPQDGLQAVIRDTEINSYLTKTGIAASVDKNGNVVSVAEKFAEMVNGRTLDATYILVNDPEVIKTAMSLQQAKSEGAILQGHQNAMVSNPQPSAPKTALPKQNPSISI